MENDQKRRHIRALARKILTAALEEDANAETVLADAIGDMKRLREDWERTEQAARRQGGAR